MNDFWKHDAGLNATWTTQPRTEVHAATGLAEPPTAAGVDESERLMRTIRADIIPRLLLAHRKISGNNPHMPATNSRAVTSRDVSCATRLVLGPEFAPLWQHVSRLRAAGVSLEALFLDLLAPTARRLGKLWEDDRIDFMRVTEALLRLQLVLRELAPEFARELSHGGGASGPRILVAAAPGETHRFGASIVAEFFRRAGWSVELEQAATDDSLCDSVARGEFDMVALSLACDVGLPALAVTVGAIRESSLNRDLGVLVGGAAFLRHPEFVSHVGADVTAADGRSAVDNAEALLADIRLRSLSPHFDGAVRATLLSPNGRT
jgi:methanogenic corrinoid protein MtbC1